MVSLIIIKNDLLVILVLLVFMLINILHRVKVACCLQIIKNITKMPKDIEIYFLPVKDLYIKKLDKILELLIYKQQLMCSIKTS